METIPGHLWSKKFVFQSSRKLVENRKQRVYLELILSFSTLVFFGVFALRPTLTTIATLVGDLTNLKMVQKQLADKIDALSIAEQKMKAIEGDLPLLDDAMPLKPELALVTAQIGTLVPEKDFVVSLVSYGAYPIGSGTTIPAALTNTTTKKVANPWSEVNFSIQGFGTYESSREFIEKISGLRRIMIIDTISIAQELKKDSSQTTNQTNLPTVLITGRIAYDKNSSL